jgi:hypothetical protein
MVGLLLITRPWFSRFICLITRGLSIEIRRFGGQDFEARVL